MKTMRWLLKEHIEQAYVMLRLSVYNLKMTYISNRLGLLWFVLNPALQILIYWVVFGLGIRGGAAVGDSPFILWLLCGLIPWFYISAGISQGAKSIYTRLSVASKMKFPLSILPTTVVLTQLYSHLVLLAVIIIIVACMKGITIAGVAGVLFYTILLTGFLVALSFVTSTLATMVRDMQLVIQSATRMAFFVTPIMWTMNERTPDVLKEIMKINPFYYFIEGYRDSLLLGDNSQIATRGTLYVVLSVLILIIAGAWMHMKSRTSFIDQI